MGFKVLGAVANGADALKIALNQELDLVLMDVNIDGDINGIETAQIIKEHKEVPIIFITAYVDEVTFTKASESEPYAYIVKPFDDRDLHFTIKTVLQQHKLKQKLADSEAKYRRLFEKSKNGLLILDNDAEILDFNEAAAAQWKLLNPQIEKLANWFDFFSSDDQEMIRQKWQRFLKKGLSNGKFNQLNSNSEIEYYDYMIEANFQDGQHLCTLRNISNLVITRKKVDYLAHLQQESPMPAYRVTITGTIVYSNQAGELLQKKWQSLHPNTLPEVLTNAIAQNHTNQEISATLKVKNRTYSVLMVLMRGKEYVNVYFIDVTETRLAEKVNNLHKDLLEMIARGINSQAVMEQVCLRIKQFMPYSQIGIYQTHNSSKSLSKSIISDVNIELYNVLLNTPLKDNHPIYKSLQSQTLAILDTETQIENIEIKNLFMQFGIIECIIVPVKNESKENIAVLVIFNFEKSNHNTMEQNLLLSTARVISLAWQRNAVLTSLYKQSLVFANMYDAIILTDIEGNVTDWNQSAQKMFGLSAKEVLNTKLTTLDLFIKPAKLYKLLKYSDNKDFDSTQKYIDELTYINKIDGNGTAEISVVSLNTPTERQGTLLVVRDISDRKIAEKALMTSEANLVSLVENTPDIIFSLDTNLCFITSNSACKNLYKYFGKDNILQGDSFYTDSLPETTVKLTRYFNKALTGIRVNIETPIQLDTLRYFDLSANPIATPEGIITGISIFARDITERKEFENELRKTNFELDSFVYRASHDLRAPLRSVLGLASIIKIEDVEEKRDEYLNLITKSINKLDKFISDLTDFSRNTRITITIEPIDFQALVLESMENLKYMDGANRVNLNLNVKNETALYSDVPRLNIILQNLLSNAIKYQSYERESKINIDLTITENQINLIISDNGKGIKIEYLRRIFEMFFRASEDSYGSGLGLYITKQVIERLNGSIVVSSEYGKGTTFAIMLPNMSQEYQSQIEAHMLESNQDAQISTNNDDFILE